jgi:hypothetical protein
MKISQVVFTNGLLTFDIHQICPYFLSIFNFLDRLRHLGHKFWLAKPILASKVSLEATDDVRTCQSSLVLRIGMKDCSLCLSKPFVSNFYFFSEKFGFS